MGWKSSLNQVLRANNKAAAKGGKAVGYATQAVRAEILDAGFKLLRSLGYRLDDVRSFKEKHMKVLGHHWEQNGLSPSSIQNRISIFRTFSKWIGKAGMVRDSIYYVKDIKSVERHLVAQKDHTWSGNKVNVEQKLAEVAKLDARVALQLSLQREFGIRMKEAALLRPHGADKGGYLAVNWGTKGGRPRAVAIQTDGQKQVLEQLKALVGNKIASLIPQDMDFKQWKNHYYYICKQAGISRKDGITGHGLRHERLNMVYKEITGVESPIRGGNTKVDKELDILARQEVSEIAGHSRESISGAYLGGKS